MVRKSLIAMAFLAVASPLAAQNPMAGPAEWQWTSDRPDAHAPMGVFGARTADEGEFEIGYRYYQTNWEKMYLGTDTTSASDLLNTYDDVPITRKDIRHELRLAWGVTENLTLVGRGSFLVLERDTWVSGGSVMRNTVEELGDVEVGALYNIFASGPYRLHVQGGAVIPTGKSITYGDRNGATVHLPYDMRTSGGTFGAILGVSGGVQNEVGSLGAQFRLRTDFGENDAGFTPGDQYEANGWAAYRFNSFLSASAGVRWENYRNIDGQDTALDFFGDPHNAGAILSGQRAHLPLGVNFMIPEGNRFAGHRLSAEAVYTLHHDMNAPQIGMDWGFNFGWSIGF
jgi:hypothetical protein